MEIIEDALFRAELIKKIREREFSERTGIHQSDLNYCLNKQALRKFYPKEDTDQETLIFSIGWATQRWLTGASEDEPEKIVDGIKVTCDALMTPPAPSKSMAKRWKTQGNVVPWELKATYQSSNKAIIENTAWIRQIMAQCYTQGATAAYLSRFEMLGDYGSVYPKGKTKEEKAAYRAEHPRPTLHTYRLSFTQEELEKNWEWFKGRKKVYEGILETKKLVPKVMALPPASSWECGYCSYIKECSAGI